MEKKNITSKNFTRVRNAIERELTQAVSIFEYGKGANYTVKHNNVDNIVVYSETYGILTGVCIEKIQEVVNKWMARYNGMDWAITVTEVMKKNRFDGDIYWMKAPMFELHFRKVEE